MCPEIDFMLVRKLLKLYVNRRGKDGWGKERPAFSISLMFESSVDVRRSASANGTGHNFKEFVKSLCSKL